MIAPVALLAALPLVLPAASPAPPAPPAPTGDVRLVVVVGVDQMIPEQLDRLAPWLGGGFGRFVREGLVFPEAMLGHGVTETGPGYTTLGTGRHPAGHGVVANEWMGPDGDGIYCMEDEAGTPVTDDGVSPGAGPGRSPRNVRVPALGDLLRAADPLAQVVSIGGKDRAAIGLGGQHPDACLWWNRGAGGFASSVWYGERLPDWALDWNASWTELFASEEWGNGWRLELPDGAERAGSVLGQQPDEASREPIEAMLRGGLMESDPARRAALLGRYAFVTPVVDLAVIGAAERAVRALDLGGDEHPDALLLGLSACDIVGHSHGPYSDEVTDLLLRVDRRLGELFALLDERVGADRWVAALAADHGVLPLPSEARRRGMDARVVPGVLVAGAIRRVEERLEEEFGPRLVAEASADGVRLSAEALSAGGFDPAAVRAAAAAAALDGSGWLERAYTREDLEAGADGDDPWRALMARSFDPERSPDVAFVRKPWTLIGMPTGTSHGTPYPYDRAIALAFVGPGVPAGRRFDAASSADVVPTLLGLLGIAPEVETDGRALF